MVNTLGVKAFDLLGNLAIVNFPKEFKLKNKKKFAQNIINTHKVVKSVFEKVGRVKGRLRKPTLKYIMGEKSREVLYKENGCIFRFNIDTTYFSPRLSNERKEIADLVKKGESVFVMFAGVAPFSIVIAKNSEASSVVSNEINREANKYAFLNADLNKVKKKIEFVNGNVKRVSKKLKKKRQKFDVIVMPRPQLKDMFLDSAFSLSKKGTRIYYYGFCKVNETDYIVSKIKDEAKKVKKKIKILKVKKAGEIAPYKIRVRVDLKVL